MKADHAARGRSADSLLPIAMLTVSGFMLFVCEQILFNSIHAKHRDLWAYADLLFIAVPFLIFFVFRSRVNGMRATGEVSPKAAMQINSDASTLVFITYWVMFGILELWF